MRSTCSKASRQTRSPRAFAASACSALIIFSSCAPARTISVPSAPPAPRVHAIAVRTSSVATPTTAKALFDFDVPLHRAAVLVGPDGAEYVGFPTADAEAILNVFEERIPAMKRVIETHETLEALLEKQVDIHKAMVVETASIADGWKTIATVWKEAAEAAEPSWFERIFFSKELWLIAGVIGGAALTKLLAD